MENGVFKNIIRKKEIKVSVIIPVYNVEKYIERCLESVIHQTLKEIEIIIINDGSSDSTSKKIEKFLGDNRVIYIKTENKGGCTPEMCNINKNILEIFDILWYNI